MEAAVTRTVVSLEIAWGLLSKPLPLAKWRGQGVALEETLGGVLESARILKKRGACLSCFSEDILHSGGLGCVEEE